MSIPFVRKPYDDSRYQATLADLIRQRGELDQARIRGSAQIASSLMQGLGQSASQYAAEYDKQKKIDTETAKQRSLGELIGTYADNPREIVRQSMSVDPATARAFIPAAMQQDEKDKAQAKQDALEGILKSTAEQPPLDRAKALRNAGFETEAESTLAKAREAQKVLPSVARDIFRLAAQPVASWDEYERLRGEAKQLAGIVGQDRLIDQYLPPVARPAGDGFVTDGDNVQFEANRRAFLDRTKDFLVGTTVFEQYANNWVAQHGHEPQTVEENAAFYEGFKKASKPTEDGSLEDVVQRFSRDRKIPTDAISADQMLGIIREYAKSKAVPSKKAGAGTGEGGPSQAQQGAAERWKEQALDDLEAKVRKDYATEIAKTETRTVGGETKEVRVGWPSEAVQDLIDGKLRIENSYRKQLGKPPVATIEEAGYKTRQPSLAALASSSAPSAAPVPVAAQPTAQPPVTTRPPFAPATESGMTESQRQRRVAELTAALANAARAGRPTDTLRAELLSLSRRR